MIFNLNDSIFNQSVILVCEDNKDGTMGFIINKPIPNDIITFEEVAKYFDIPISEVKRIYKKSQY